LKAKSLLLGLISGAVFATGALANEVVKVGFVNTERLYREAPIAIKAQKKLQTEFGKREEEIVKMRDRLKKLQESFDKDGVTMSESDRRMKERDFNELSRDLQRKERELREDLNIRKNEEMAQIVEKANAAVKQVAEREKFDLIIQEAVWVSPRLDVTDRVIKALSEGK